MYPPPGVVEPITVVMRDIDMKVKPEYFEAENMSGMGDGAFIITDIFDIPDDSDIEAATLIAILRQREISGLDEANMAVLYYYDADAFDRLKPGGVLTTSRPSPLSREQIEYVLLRLRDHPNYKGYTISCHDREFNLITLRDGKIV